MVGKVDDIHFLKQRTTSVEISNQFKYISNEFPLTIVFIGIDLRQRAPVCPEEMTRICQMA